MIETWEQQVDFMRAIPDSAVKILWILFISGRSLTNKELRYACDKSDKTIQAGLEWLEPRGFVQNNGKFNGWSLAVGAFQQLPLPSSQLGIGHQSALPAQHGAATPQNGDGESSTPKETRKFSVFLSSSSSSSDLPEERDQEEEEERPQTRRISVFPDAGIVAVRQMLIDAGIGPRSRKLPELLALELDVDFVAAHVHVWQVRSEPPGYLITRLESGEAPPLCNCPDCRVLSHIPAAYADIVVR